MDLAVVRWVDTHHIRSNHVRAYEASGQAGELTRLTLDLYVNVVPELGPLLGLATTEQLLTEVQTRAQIATLDRPLASLMAVALGTTGRGILAYRTVDE
jgi:hypothetical protein